MTKVNSNIRFPLLKLFALLVLGIVLSSLVQYNIIGTQTQEESIELNPSLYLLSIGLFQILTFLLPAVIWLKYIEMDVYYWDNIKTTSIRITKVVLLFILVYFVANILHSITGNLFDQYYPVWYEKVLEEATAYTSLFQQKQIIWLSILVVGVIPAICEEFFFRAGIFGYLEQKTGSFWHSAILSSILFAGVHLQITQFFPIFLLGMALAGAYYYTRSIWVPIILHMINNTVQIIIIHKGIEWF